MKCAHCNGTGDGREYICAYCDGTGTQPDWRDEI